MRRRLSGEPGTFYGRGVPDRSTCTMQLTGALDVMMLNEWGFCASSGSWSACEDGIVSYSLEQKQPWTRLAPVTIQLHV